MLRIFILFALAVLTGVPSFAQTTVTLPKVGQPGKDVVWVPTTQTLVTKMLDLARVTERDFVIDLGSGDGRLVIAAAQRGARALGIEYNSHLVELSRQMAEKEGVGDRVEFLNEDIYQSDLTRATVITLFLGEEINRKLQPKLLNLKPGTRIVSNTFKMDDWKTDDFDRAETKEDEGYSRYNRAWLWIVPAKVEGTWLMSEGELMLTQKFQMLEGWLKLGEERLAISNGQLRGAQIHFTIDGSDFMGQVNGYQIQGSMIRDGKTAPWTALRSPTR